MLVCIFLYIKRAGKVNDYYSYIVFDDNVIGSGMISINIYLFLTNLIFTEICMTYTSYMSWGY